jgi:hypothetical protein
MDSCRSDEDQRRAMSERDSCSENGEHNAARTGTHKKDQWQVFRQIKMKFRIVGGSRRVVWV